MKKSIIDICETIKDECGENYWQKSVPKRENYSIGKVGFRFYYKECWKFIRQRRRIYEIVKRAIKENFNIQDYTLKFCLQQYLEDYPYPKYSNEYPEPTLFWFCNEDNKQWICIGVYLYNLDKKIIPYFCPAGVLKECKNYKDAVWVEKNNV